MGTYDPKHYIQLLNPIMYADTNSFPQSCSSSQVSIHGSWSIILATNKDDKMKGSSRKDPEKASATEDVEEYETYQDSLQYANQIDAAPV